MTRITIDMSITDMFSAMAGNNIGAITVLKEMLQVNPLDILLLDTKGIYESKIWMLYNDCCRRDSNRFQRTLMMIRCSVFTNEEIHKNLDRTYAIPFIDDSIEMDDTPPYGEDFGPTHPLWEKWCEAQRNSFISRMAAN